MRYVIAASKSRFTVQAFARGLLAGFGHNPALAIRDFAGEADFAPDALDEAAVRVSVQAESLTVIDDVSEQDQREIERTLRAEVLETTRYPEITFQSTEVTGQRTGEGRYRVRLTGELSLHGVTRPQVVEARVILQPDSLRAQGAFSLRQSDYGIEPVAALGGMLKVKDAVELAFDFVARQASQHSD